MSGSTRWGRWPTGCGLPALSAPIPAGLVEHDRGKVLVQTMEMLAGGGEACSDIECLRAQPELFGGGAVGLDAVPHHSLHRRPTPSPRYGKPPPGCEARLWRRTSVTTGAAPVLLDLDASLVQIHS